MIIIMIEVKMQSVLKLKGVMPLNAPHFVVHIIAVQVSGQAIFIGAESFVASMDVDGVCLRVVHTAVPIATLNQRPTSL